MYHLKVTLDGTKPPIWRRLQVPATIRLSTLHEVLQIAMGWEEEHLHEFDFGDAVYGRVDPDDDDFVDEPPGDERKVRLAELAHVGTRFVYTYDFGDGWEHGIDVEEVRPPEPGVRYPRCTGGRRNGPPEDCGGVPGYHRLVRVLKSPTHPDYRQLRRWVGRSYDPAAFHLDAINRALADVRLR